MQHFSRVFSALADTCFPRTCHLCGTSLPADSVFLCLPCLLSLPRTGFHNIADNKVERKLASVISMKRATSWLYYSPDSSVATLIHDLKYRRFPSLGAFLGRHMAIELLPTGFFGDVDAIQPVPLHFLKKFRRTYNQTEMIAQGISEVIGSPVTDALRARAHTSQTRMSHARRLLNANGVYSIKDHKALEGKHILLVDDVCTTGATLSSIGNLIETELPATRLSFLTLCATDR